MNIPFVDLKAQYEEIGEEIDRAAASVISKTAFIGGPFVKDFEQAFAAFCGAEHCIGTGNGTDALYLALRCAGVGEGDRVIVPANSFIATSEAVTQTGAQVVFCDVDDKTHTIDIPILKSLVTPEVKAIIPVHLYGHPADMDPIMELAEANKMVVVEDAAQAHGALYRGKPVGTIGHAGCFSFYPGKNLGAYGDAGAVVTNDSKLSQKIRMTANHGRSDKYDHLFEGINSRLDGLQASILSTKLKHLPKWTDMRRRNAGLYNDLLKGTGVTTPPESSHVRSVYHLYVIRVPDGKRDALRAYLSDKGVATGIHYPIALPLLKAYARLGHGPEDFPRASAQSADILSLPMYPELSEAQITYICEHTRDFFAEK